MNVSLPGCPQSSGKQTVSPTSPHRVWVPSLSMGNFGSFCSFWQRKEKIVHQSATQRVQVRSQNSILLTEESWCLACEWGMMLCFLLLRYPWDILLLLAGVQKEPELIFPEGLFFSMHHKLRGPGMQKRFSHQLCFCIGTVTLK